jgi:ubiquinone/menaquinone biosynthesis C-methylase UbiE
MFNSFEPPEQALAHPPAASTAACAIPQYLEDTYWWAYVHPRAVKFFDRHFLVNLILFGNYRRLRDAALRALGGLLPGRTLQVACVYGDFTQRVAERIQTRGQLDVVDVLPIQLDNLRRKLPRGAPISLFLQDSSALGFADDRYDQALVFFLLHEQPEEVRRGTLREVMRVVKPGGKVVVVDYHLPHRLNPLRYLMRPLLGKLEPFALDLWAADVLTWLPEGIAPERISKRTFFGGLYQKLVIRA